MQAKVMHRPVQPPTCASCGYDLTGVPIQGRDIRCPECGGNRVRLFRWYEPKLSRRRALLYLPAAALAACPGLLAGLLILLGTDARQTWILACLPPYACLGVALAAWRPGLHAGVTILGLGAVLAFLLGSLLAITLRLPPNVSPMLSVPLGVFYFVIPPPFGLLWAYAVLGDT